MKILMDGIIGVLIVDIDGKNNIVIWMNYYFLGGINIIEIGFLIVGEGIFLFYFHKNHISDNFSLTKILFANK